MKKDTNQWERNPDLGAVRDSNMRARTGWESCDTNPRPRTGWEPRDTNLRQLTG